MMLYGERSFIIYKCRGNRQDFDGEAVGFGIWFTIWLPRSRMYIDVANDLCVHSFVLGPQ